MPRFNEAFLFLARGGDLAERGVRENELARTVYIPAPDTDTAAVTAAELLPDGLDLIELYGLGPPAAAKVLAATRGEVPVGLVGLEDHEVVRHRAVITPAPGADPAIDRYVHQGLGSQVTIVSVPDPAAVPATAGALVTEGVDRIDLCGGLGPVPAAAAIEAVGDRVPVGVVMFGFESLAAVADYRVRFERALAD